MNNVKFEFVGKFTANRYKNLTMSFVIFEPRQKLYIFQYAKVQKHYTGSESGTKSSEDVYV